MTEAEAAETLTALAQETRLKLFRQLVRAGPDGLAAGILSDRLGVSSNLLSSHLNTLRHAGLIHVRSVGRNRIYVADMAAVGEVIRFLVAECCAGSPEACAPVMEALGASRC